MREDTTDLIVALFGAAFSGLIFTLTLGFPWWAFFPIFVFSLIIFAVGDAG